MFQKRFFTSIVLILGVIALIFFAPWPLFMGIGVLLVTLAQKEFFEMMDKRGLHPLVFFGIFSGIVLLVVQFISIHYPALETSLDLTPFAYFLVVFGTFLVVLARFGKVALIACIATTLMGVFYVGWLFSFLVKIRYFHGGSGNWFLLFLLLVTKATDIAAYIVGSLLGKRKLIPVVSPRKTVEGAVGGILGAILMGSVIFGIWGSRLKPFGWMDVMFLTILFGFFAQIGDIIESALKRDAGIKDSGKIFPGMGGMLDLIDSLLVTGPIMYFYMVQRML